MRGRSLLFDKQDHELVVMVEGVLGRRAKGKDVISPDASLHPHGVVELSTRPTLRMAEAVVTLLASLRADDSLPRLQALQRLYDEVVHSAHSSLRLNTGRVLIQLMKELVRSTDRTRRLMLAHEFHQAVHGTPRVVRRLLHRYHLLEMPESWSQQAFDHHVHDANTKGRKTPTHLMMDAWVKGIRFLSVIYYNYVDADAARELLTAAQIIGIRVRIGIEFRTTFRGRFVDITWSPLECYEPELFIKMLADARVAELLQDYCPASELMYMHSMAMLHRWNTCHILPFAKSLGITPPPPVDRAAFITFVGHDQPMNLHLAEYIYDQVAPALQAKLKETRAALTQETDMEARRALVRLIRKLQDTVPDTIADEWLSHAANPDMPSLYTPHEGMPAILEQSPAQLAQRLTTLPPGQIILNLSELSVQDVLEILWRARGGITHLELFNLKEWAGGKLSQTPDINELQIALNEGSAPRLKHLVQHISAMDMSTDKDRHALFEEIQGNIPALQQLYARRPLGSRIGTDSTSRSHHTHGMGLAFVETLPPQVQRRLDVRGDRERLRLPVTTDIYGFTHYHEQPLAGVTGGLIRALRHVPGLKRVGCRVVSGWGLEKNTTRVGEGGNLVTLGGVNAQGIMEDRGEERPDAVIKGAGWEYMNADVMNAVKILAGFLPAQWAFCYTDGWWFLTWFGALLWFFITGFRNIIQFVVSGSGFKRAVLLPWRRYISWNRLADSLLYTGISVPLLEVFVRRWLLEDGLHMTVQDNALAVYTVIAMVNSVYISSHNIFRGFPKAAVIGNLFRSALAIPLSMIMGEMLFHLFSAMHLSDPAGFTQNCAAITSKCASDTVAAVIEGIADSNVYRKLRRWDYNTKYRQIFRNFTRQELLFPHTRLDELYVDPEHYYAMLCEKEPDTANTALVNMLDLMYFWYYQPRAREVFSKMFRELSQEERVVVLEMLGLLTMERQICELFLSGVCGRKFSSPLAFYLQYHKQYVAEIRKLAARLERQGAV